MSTVAAPAGQDRHSELPAPATELSPHARHCLWLPAASVGPYVAAGHAVHPAAEGPVIWSEVAVCAGVGACGKAGVLTSESAVFKGRTGPRGHARLADGGHRARVRSHTCGVLGLAEEAGAAGDAFKAKGVRGRGDAVVAGLADALLHLCSDKRRCRISEAWPSPPPTHPRALHNLFRALDLAALSSERV